MHIFRVVRSSAETMFSGEYCFFFFPKRARSGAVCEECECVREWCVQAGNEITPRYLCMRWQGREFFVTKYSCLVAVCGILYHSRFSVRLLLYMANNALLRTVTAFCSCVQHQLKVILTEREREIERKRE